MTRKVVFFLGAFVVAFCLDQSVLPLLFPNALTLRLVTLLTIAVAMDRGPIAGAFCGFVAGVPLGLVGGEPLGLSSLSLTLTGYAAGELASRFAIVSIPARAALAFGMLALEMAVTMGAAWVVFGIFYRVNGLNLLAAALSAPLVFAAARPFVGRTSFVQQYKA